MDNLEKGIACRRMRTDPRNVNKICGDLECHSCKFDVIPRYKYPTISCIISNMNKDRNTFNIVTGTINGPGIYPMIIGFGGVPYYNLKGEFIGYMHKCAEDVIYFNRIGQMVENYEELKISE